MITVDYGDGIREADESMFEKRTGQIDNDCELTNWIEYWDGDKCVHRSVHIQLKRGIGIESVMGKIGG